MESVSIRPLLPEDSSKVTEIWLKGLQQTIDTSSWIIWPLVSFFMPMLASHATSEDGDFGPNGKNLEKHWTKSETGDRAMFVAELTYLDSTSGLPATKVVGCCAVKRGLKESEISPPECTDYSVFRLSVDEECRGMGVAKKLMDTVEDWAKKNGALKISLNTGNAVAAKFYAKNGYQSIGWLGGTFEKIL